VRRLELEHRYHDEDPVQGAEFTVTFPNGLVVSGKLAGEGKATLIGVPARGEVRYGPDQRAFERVDSGPNSDHRGPLAEADFETLRAKHGG
jgi:type VI secretion system secreted protein VgrG